MRPVPCPACRRSCFCARSFPLTPSRATPCASRRSERISAAPLPVIIHFRTPEASLPRELNPGYSCDSGVMASQAVYTGAYRPCGTGRTVTKRLPGCQAGDTRQEWPGRAGTPRIWTCSRRERGARARPAGRRSYAGDWPTSHGPGAARGSEKPHSTGLLGPGAGGVRDGMARSASV